MTGGGDGLGEGEEGQGQVHEAVLEGLQLLVSLDDLDELQAHQAHHRARGGGDGWDDLTGDQLALERRDERLIKLYPRRERERSGV